MLFQIFLDEFSKRHQEDLHIIFLDRAKYHTTARLNLPENILLEPLPPYSPELDPMERIWEYIKEQIAWEHFKGLNDLSDRICEIIQSLTKEELKSLSLYPYIKEYFDSAP